MKSFIILVALVCLMGCSHVPRTAVMVNPQTGEEVTLSKRANIGTVVPFVGIYGCMAQRQNQQYDINAYKAKGFKTKWESKSGL